MNSKLSESYRGGYLILRKIPAKVGTTQKREVLRYEHL